MRQQHRQADQRGEQEPPRRSAIGQANCSALAMQKASGMATTDGQRNLALPASLASSATASVAASPAAKVRAISGSHGMEAPPDDAWRGARAQWHAAGWIASTSVPSAIVPA
ncbi:MAG: hypothetical protein ACTHKZ_02480 [Lysobacteraceae bacterium]